VIFKLDIGWMSNPLARRQYEGTALVDFGDHVEWSDGERSTRMRLPDQPHRGTSEPVLARVLVATFKSQPYAPNMITFYRIRFLDESGRVIAWFGRNANTGRQIAEHLLEESRNFKALADRGVRVESAVYRSEKPFYDAHPDPRVHGAALAIARNPWLWIGGPIVTIIVIVLIVMAAMGKFSS
jgi:hypothetical protein